MSIRISNRGGTRWSTFGTSRLLLPLDLGLSRGLKLLDEDGPTEVLEVEVLGVARVPAVLRLKLLLDVEVELVPCVAGSGSVVYGPER